MRVTSVYSELGVIVKTTSDLLRVLVIAERIDLSDDVDRALWVWPHCVSSVVDWTGAIQVSKQFRPSVVCAPLPKTDSDKELCRLLRAQHANIPIIGYADTSTYFQLGSTDAHPFPISLKKD